MGLFDEPSPTMVPLADRLRPHTLDEIAGQKHILGPGKALRQAIEADRIPPMVLVGPPGSGKTTLARTIADVTRAVAVLANAVSCTVADLRKIAEDARRRQRFESRRTILFLDELHRLARNQQEVLLPYLEDGSVILIGATTENPYFELSRAMLSRLRVVRLEPLAEGDLEAILDRALAHPLGFQGALEVAEEAKDALLQLCGGDARRLITLLEQATASLPPGVSALDAATVRGLADEGYAYDRSGDMHYDVASAFIKSVRGSDAEAALYWMARMLEGGEAPRFIARRLVILAAEDVGLADPHALPLAMAAAHALEFVGLPEAALHLSEATLYLSLCKKSNTVTQALSQARQLARQHPVAPVPVHLRDTHSTDTFSLSSGTGYRYPHSVPTSHLEQQYLPDGVAGGWLRGRSEGEEPRLFRERPGGPDRKGGSGS